MEKHFLDLETLYVVFCMVSEKYSLEDYADIFLDEFSASSDPLNKTLHFGNYVIDKGELPSHSIPVEEKLYDWVRDTWYCCEKEQSRIKDVLHFMEERLIFENINGSKAFDRLHFKDEFCRLVVKKYTGIYFVDQRGLIPKYVFDFNKRYLR